MSETLPTNKSIADALRHEVRYLPRLNTPAEAEAFRNAGDVIQVNEGDFWLLLMLAREAADRLDPLTPSPIKEE